MKKRTWIKGLVLSFFCFTLLGCAACQVTQDSSVDSVNSMINSEDSSSSIEPSVECTGICTINGFESNDDLYRIKQKQVENNIVFDMRISNEQKQTGENSLKCYYESGAFGNVVQRMQETEYASCDIVDIKTFSLWAYNANNVNSSITLSALKTGSAPFAKQVINLPAGEWTKCTLPLNQVAMEGNASEFYAFAFSFKSTVIPATYYVDEMQVEFGNELTEADQEYLVKIDDLIANIDQLPEPKKITLANEAELKEIYDAYEALPIEYRCVVTNYNVFEKAVAQLLVAAKGTVDYTKDSVACYFDKFYGVYQAKAGVSSFPNLSYTEEVKYQDEEGALCIECTGDLWTYVNFTSNIPIDKYATTTFAVYNGSDMPIVVFFGWQEKTKTDIMPGKWAEFELDNRDHLNGIEMQLTAWDASNLTTTGINGCVYISRMTMHSKPAEEKVYTLYDMNNFSGILKETFANCYTYDEKFETVPMDGYGDVLKITANNVITYESVNGAPTDTVSASKNVTISYNPKSTALDYYDVVKFSIYNPYDLTVPIVIIDGSWGTGPDGVANTGDEEFAHRFDGYLNANSWTEFEMSAKDFMNAGKILFVCAGIMQELDLDSVEFYISDITAYGRLHVMDLIDNLPEADVVTEANAEEVLSVLTEYNKLSDEHKLLVTNYDKLLECLQKAGVTLEK